MALKLNFLLRIGAGLVLLHMITQLQAQDCLNGFQCLNCTHYSMCVSGVPAAQISSCPQLNATTQTYCFNSNPQMCAVGTCPPSCIAAGRFPDPYNSSQYVICIPDSSQPSGYNRFTYPCPTGSIYSNATSLCIPIPTTTTSTTPSTATTTTTTPSTTTVSTTTPAYTCTRTGRYPDARNCSIYYLCLTNPAGGWSTYKYTCPPPSLFNSVTGKCASAATAVCSSVG